MGRQVVRKNVQVGAGGPAGRQGQAIGMLPEQAADAAVSAARWARGRSCGTLQAMPASAPTLFQSARAFEAWSKKNHAACDGLWLQIAKRAPMNPA